MRTNTQGTTKMKKPVALKSPKMPTKTSVATPDYAVCKEAMNNPKVFAELARWGREEIKPCCQYQCSRLSPLATFIRNHNYLRNLGNSVLFVCLAILNTISRGRQTFFFAPTKFC